MDWLSDYVAWCKSFADNFTEINVETSDYVNLANAIGGSLARCFIGNDGNLWITTAHPQACSKSRINTAVNEYNTRHAIKVTEEKDKFLLARNFGAICFSFWRRAPISD